MHAQSVEDPFASLVAAEQAFAADATRVGITPAFRAHAAQDSVLLAPGPVSAPEHLAKRGDTPGLTLEWHPSMAGVARSGDLGFTSGPYRMVHGGKVLSGQFLTVWSRGADGRWRWVLDHGLPPKLASGAAAVGPAAVMRFAFLAASEAKTIAGHSLDAAEQALDLGYVDRGLAALLPLLAEDGYLLRPGRDAIAKVDARNLAPDPRHFVRSERLGTRVSEAGDLAASYGRLVPENGDPAYYVRVWRRGERGWELLIDEMI
ncbi:hypothetical protein P6144_11215 [Sphingomonas sp. HITSZ_GF]|uniref:hypothetical protein n=1 Tax=Sphingomonas sp. HITSZ_GF TaxID=3037247 RepID=UPI00240CFF86|nr:hypothetical protein [Sphingomonas sp. HITSZ_GF]MDG2534221.1 hypothetical protein [Sphingomonas sp. HITSZ_GF]